MQEEPNLGQRLGGYAVLMFVALLLVLGSRSPAIRSLFEDPEPPEPQASMQRQPVPPISLDSATVGEVDAAIDAGYDVSQLPLLADNSLAPDPIAITYKPALPEHNFITYTVKEGDTAIGIAERFGITDATILGGNPFLSNDAGQLMPGTVLTILPIDGALHTVTEGESLDSLSLRYGIPAEDIIAYAPNNLEFPYRLQPGTEILVPGAVVEAFFWEPPVTIVTSRSGSSPETIQGIYVAPLGTGSFVWPIGSRNITQYYWYGHPGLDLSAAEGSAVVAADSGTVTYAAWSPHCYGYLIVLNHGNGYETFYAHLSGIYVSPGQQVTKGVTIGASGNSGCSSGPHLHFEIRYNRVRYDPLSYLP